MRCSVNAALKAKNDSKNYKKMPALNIFFQKIYTKQKHKKENITILKT